jgi:ATPase family protein associated with various cellular activities (AAA)/winged helix domain-containing protein
VDPSAGGQMTSATVAEGALAPLLAWAAETLARTLDAAGDVSEPLGGLEALRGMVLSRDSVLDALEAEADTLGPIVDPPPLPAALGEPLQRAGADAFDAAAVGLALAVELDPAAARAVAYLQDDARLRRFSATLLARLCTAATGDCTAGVRRLAPSDMLATRGLLEIAGRSGEAEVRATAALVAHATGVGAATADIAAVTRRPTALPVTEHDDAVQRWARAPEQHVLHVHGAAADVLTARVAAALADAGRPVVVVELAAVGEQQSGALAAHCLLDGLTALLVLPAQGHPALERLLGCIDAVCVVDDGLALWQSPAVAASRRLASVELGTLDAAERAGAVDDRLGIHGITLERPGATQAFARRYRHGPEAIARVAAVTAARLRAAGRPTACDTDILDVAAMLAGAPLRDLATRVERVVGWPDLAVRDTVAEQLRELCARVDVRESVLDEGGYGARIGGGRGVSALFAGPSGAGKTLAASVIACELGLALYRVDLARVVSKYIGDTERNLEAIFTAAESTDVVLLFDEADALFGRRSEVSDAHDRYANLEVAYLLQRMETYDGVAILSTNLLRNLDDAFARRLDFRVLFPFPGLDERRRIWQLMWPSGARLAADIDLDELASEHELSGGTIRNAALAAAHLAASEQAVVSQRHLDRAIAREYDKLGRLPRMLTSSES